MKEIELLNCINYHQYLNQFKKDIQQQQELSAAKEEEEEGVKVIKQQEEEKKDDFECKYIYQYIRSISY